MDEKKFTRHWVAIATVYLAVLLDGAVAHVLVSGLCGPRTLVYPN
ncbi:hypothetical protein [Lacticaseibacillus pantheris]|nr:hypothetical protein [Lacticaseibacillus pantheris]